MACLWRRYSDLVPVRVACVYANVTGFNYSDLTDYRGIAIESGHLPNSLIHDVHR